jgi:outer membrane receptor protein involved in Fe transport
LIFASEEAEGGEIGFKSQWADRSFTLNATAFYYVFTDLQVQNFNAVSVQFATSNAGELTTKGVDLETRWNTPVTGLNLSANLSYLDAEYTDTFIQPLGISTIDLDGRRGSQRNIDDFLFGGQLHGFTFPRNSLSSFSASTTTVPSLSCCRLPTSAPCSPSVCCAFQFARSDFDEKNVAALARVVISVVRFPWSSYRTSV